MLQQDIDEMERYLAQQHQNRLATRRRYEKRHYCEKRGLISPRGLTKGPASNFRLGPGPIDSRVRLPAPVAEWLLRMGGAPFARKILGRPVLELQISPDWPSNAKSILMDAYQLSMKTGEMP